MTRQSLVFAAVAIVAALAARSAAGQADPLAARLRGGSLPGMPVQAVSAGEVLLSVNVSDAGAVGPIDVLRSTPPFTDAVLAAVRDWRFAPAEDALRKPMASRVLVGAMFGPPSLNTPTVGEPPKDVAPAAASLPWPAATTMPLYPPNARSAGAVLVETLVAATGKVVGVTVVRSAPPFDNPAMDAARAWSFRPPQAGGVPPNAYVYLIFVFRPPVVGPAPKK